MNRLISLAAALAFCGVNALAADASAPALHFGAHVGVNFASTSVSTSGPSLGTNPSPTTSTTGFLGGVLLEAPLTDMFGLQPELNFIQKGSGDNSNPANVTKLSYIEVPVFVKAKFNFGGVKPFAMAGPAIGFLLSAKTTPGSGGDSSDQKNNFNSIDFGLDFAVGAAYAVTDSIDVFLDVRYALGLANIVNQTNALGSAYPSNTYTSKNKGFQITAGLMF